MTNSDGSIPGKNKLFFYDCNSFIGRHENPYAGSPLTIDMFEQSMKNSGIINSLIHHSASVLYDAAYGNKILVEEAGEKTFASLCWVVVPEMCGSEKEAEKFYNQMMRNKISAVKIFPHYHDFILKNDSLKNLLKILDLNRVPLLVSQDEISWDEIIYILDEFKKLPFLLLNSWYRMERYVSPLLRKYKNFNLDISRYQTCGGIEYLCNNYGSERIFFGSGSPVFSPEPIMMMIECADISYIDKENIAGKNLMRLLNRD